MYLETEANDKGILARGLFGKLDEQYPLSNRSSDMNNEVEWDGLDRSKVLSFQAIFNNF